jgi:hypothetical protein
MSTKKSIIYAAILAASTLVAWTNSAIAATPAEVCITADGSWTPPTGLTTLKRLIAVGGGAAGGADNVGNFGAAGRAAPNGATGGTGWGAGGGAGLGGGGGQAGAVIDMANVPVSSTVTVQIGDAGTTAGANGTQTCFGTNCANGGIGGGAFTDFSAVSGGQGGWGGTSGTGTKTSPIQEFGSIYTGQTSSAKTISVVNNSGATTTFQSISAPSNVNVYSDNCSGKTIAAGASCTFNVTVSPTTVGDLTRTIPVRTDRGILNVAVHATGQTPPSCNLPWGGTIASGQSTTAYLYSSVPYGSYCYAETRTCSNGSLSGSYQNSYCSVQPGASCSLPWGGTISDGQSVYAYQSSSGTSCSGQWRTCNNGSLSGSGSYQSCSVVSYTWQWTSGPTYKGYATYGFCGSSMNNPGGTACSNPGESKGALYCTNQGGYSGGTYFEYSYYQGTITCK